MVKAISRLSVNLRSFEDPIADSIAFLSNSSMFFFTPAVCEAHLSRNSCLSLCKMLVKSPFLCGFDGFSGIHALYLDSHGNTGAHDFSAHRRYIRSR